FREARRVLRPGGVLLFNVWDSLEKNVASRIANDVVQSMFKNDPPQFIHVPFSMQDRRGMERQLRSAGFERITFDDVALTTESPTARQFATGIVRGTPLF